MKHYPILSALIMALGLVAFSTQNGCQWEEPVQIAEPGAVPTLLTATNTLTLPSTLTPAPVAAAEVKVVECSLIDYGAGLDWWAIAYYSGLTETDLIGIRTMAHHLNTPGMANYMQKDAHIGNGEVWVRCGTGFDYVVFSLNYAE